jgi:hypothetical protein
LPQLNGIAATKNLAFEHIEINAGGAVVKFLVQYGEAKPFVSKANSALSQLSTAAVDTGARSADPDLGDSLSKIAALFDKGLLSEEEFLTAKKKILGA